MAFDGIVLKSILTEINNLIGAKIDKVFEPDKNTIALGLYLPGQHFLLNMCIDARNYRINLTTHPKENPISAPNFCMLLRKHLIGGRISKINMQGLERILIFEIETLNEFNEIEIKKLVIELMGKHSNIILLNSKEIIIDSLRHIEATDISYRDILPSKLYTFPKSEKREFLDLNNFEEFYNLIGLEDDSKKISNTFNGFSTSFINFAIEKNGINLSLKEDLEKLYNYINKIIEGAKTHSLVFTQYLNDYVLDFGNPSSYSLNFFIDDYYFERENKDSFNSLKANLLHSVLEVQKKYNSRLKSINSKLQECSDMEKYKLYGELITSNLYRLTNTHTEYIELENYYDNNNLLRIPLDKKYSPNINAKRFFKKYSKLKNALEIVSIQKEETTLELNYIDSIIYEIENASSLEELKQIAEEISENVVFKKKINKKQSNNKKFSKTKKTLPIYAPLKYDIDGYTVLVGRNNKENDYLTLSLASKSDIWFHTKDIHGSHVILKANILNVSQETLVKCAKVAAKYSKAKLSSNIPVDYCEVKFVKKTKNSKPGMVIYTNNKTLYVTPN